MKTSKESNLCVATAYATSAMAEESRMVLMSNARKYAQCDLLLKMYYNRGNDYWILPQIIMKTATISKDIPHKKVVEKPKKRDYAYTELSKLKVGSAPVNVYGIVLDATFPHKSFKSEKYICTYKIADPSSKIIDGVADYVSVVFFSKRFEDLPIC